MDFFEKSCPVCSKSFQNDDDIVVCPKCGAPYHRDCYDKTGKCIFPALHQSHQSWREVYDTAPKSDTTKKNDNPSDFITCPMCGEANPKNSPICKKCGNILADKHSGFPFYIDDDFYGSENNENGDNEKNPNFTAGNPFVFFFDPMGGVAKDEDFDGVKGAELAKFVRANTPYYMPTFKKIKTADRSRFNFAAFFLTGGWYLYRKQYILGTIMSVLYFLLVLARYIVTTWFTAPLLKEIISAVSASGVTSPSYNDIMSWALANSSQTELWLICLPSMISFLTFILQLVCGFTATRTYYHHSIRTIRKIKQSHSSEDTPAQITEKGGVNTPLAWSMMVCYLIATFAFSLL